MEADVATYWVTWSCDGYSFDAFYDTREARDRRIEELRAEEVKGISDGTTEPFAHDITTYEM
jgi:hypothetical protein